MHNCTFYVHPECTCSLHRNRRWHKKNRRSNENDFSAEDTKTIITCTIIDFLRQRRQLRWPLSTFFTLGNCDASFDCVYGDARPLVTKFIEQLEDGVYAFEDSLLLAKTYKSIAMVAVSCVSDLSWLFTVAKPTTSNYTSKTLLPNSGAQNELCSAVTCSRDWLSLVFDPHRCQPSAHSELGVYPLLCYVPLCCDNNESR